MTARTLASATVDYEQAVAAKLRGCLAEKRITKHQLAEKLGQSDFWVGRRTNGQTPITVGELLAIAAVLDEPLETFLPFPQARSAGGARPGSFLAVSARSTAGRADYGSEGWEFESLRARSPFRRVVKQRRRNSSHVVPLSLVAAAIPA